MKKNIKNLNDLDSEYQFCETEEDKLAFFNQIGDQLNDLVKTKDDLIKLFKITESSAVRYSKLEEFIVTNLRKRIEEFVDDAATLRKIRGYCHGGYFIDAINHKLPGMIVDAKSYADIIQSLDSDYDDELLRQNAFLKATRYKLPEIIKNIDDLIIILQNCQFDQSTTLDLVKPDLLQNMMDSLTEADFKRLFAFSNNHDPVLQDSLGQHKILTMLDGKIKNYIHTISDYTDFRNNLSDSNRKTIHFLDLCHDKFLDSNNQITSSFNSFFKISANTDEYDLRATLSHFKKYFGDDKQIYLQAINQVNVVYRQMLEDDIKRHSHTFFTSLNSDKKPAEYANRRMKIEISHLIENFIMNKSGNEHIAIDSLGEFDQGIYLQQEIYEIARRLMQVPENTATRQAII